MVFVTDSNRPQPLRQPPPTARLTACGAASDGPSLRTHPPPPRTPQPLTDVRSGADGAQRGHGHGPAAAAAALRARGHSPGGARNGGPALRGAAGAADAAAAAVAAVLPRRDAGGQDRGSGGGRGARGGGSGPGAAGGDPGAADDVSARAPAGV